jgi:membrane protein implicated in regulation of membrane protease activity
VAEAGNPLNPVVFVSVVCVCESDPDAELEPIAKALDQSFPVHELVAAVRAEGPLRTPSLPNLHVLQLAPPADDRVRLAAALDRCLGDVIVIVDPARDQPQAVIEAAVQVADGAESVYQLRSDHGVRHWVRETARTAVERAVGTSILPVEGVRACNREVLSSWTANPDRDRLVQGFPAITGHRWERLQSSGNEHRRDRLRWRLAAVMASSASPLRWAAAAGLLAAALNLIYSAYVVVINIVQGTTEGWTSLSLQMAGMFFLFSIILALLAEYMYQLLKRGRERPLYRVHEETQSPSIPVRERLNVEDPAGNPLG